MFGTHFYYQRIKKAVAIFGSLFNNIYVVRKNTTGSVISQMKVPLTYAPKRDFIDRLDKMEIEGDNAERQIAVKLPRMSFEITSMNYDATRQLPKMNQCTVPSTIFDGKAKKIYSPVPYNVGFQLSVYAKSQDDALQIVEQILPFFTPQYTVTVNPLDDFDVKEDTPVTMTGISFSDDYEGLLEARRTIIYTLDFEMKINLYKGIPASSAIITQYDIDILSLDGTELFTTISDSANIPYYNTGTTAENTTLTVDNFKIRNVPRTTSGFFIADSPEHGTASVTYDGTLTTVNGVIVATGSWTYTPDSNYYGADTFDIGINWGNDVAAQFSVPVTINVTNVVNTVTDSVNVDYETSLDFFVSGNDTLLGPVTYSVAAGGDPAHGTATVLNASTGQFRYLPDSGYSGLDSFVYRATPAVGTSETATVNVLVADPLPFDPLYSDVLFLAPLDGTDGSTVFTDYSSSPKVVTTDVTPGGSSPEIDTAQYKFGNSSLLAAQVDNGGVSSIGFLNSAGSWPFNVYTIEFWYKFTANNASDTSNFEAAKRFETSTNRTYFRILMEQNSTTWQVTAALQPGSGAGSVCVLGPATILTGQWNHIALTSSGDDRYFFLNGQLVETKNQSINPPTSTGRVSFGVATGLQSSSGTQAIQTWTDDIRITAACRYTANFTPPTAAFPLSG